MTSNVPESEKKKKKSKIYLSNGTFGPMDDDDDEEEKALSRILVLAIVK